MNGPDQTRMSEDVRTAFSDGVSFQTASTFLRAREAGLGWEAATEAAADGLAKYYGAPVPSRELPSTRRHTA